MGLTREVTTTTATVLPTTPPTGDNLTRLLKEGEGRSPLVDTWLSKVRYVAQNTTYRIMLFGCQVRNIDPSGRIKDHQRIYFLDNEHGRTRNRDIPRDIGLVIPMRFRTHMQSKHVYAQAKLRGITVLPEMQAIDVRGLLAYAFMSAQELRDLVMSKFDATQPKYARVPRPDLATAPLVVAAQLGRTEPIPEPTPPPDERSEDIGMSPVVAPAGKRKRRSPGELSRWIETHANFDAPSAREEIARLLSIAGPGFSTQAGIASTFYDMKRKWRERAAAGGPAPTPPPEPTPPPPPDVPPLPSPAPAPPPATATEKTRTSEALDLADAALVLAQTAILDAREAVRRARAGVSEEITDRILETLTRTMQNLNPTTKGDS